MPLDAQSVFGLDISAFELFVRTSIIYLGLMFLLRVIGRREAGSLELPDLLMILLIADGVQNGISGRYSTVTGAAIVGGTILTWNFVLSAAVYRFEFIQKLVQPKPLLLVREGSLVRGNMRKEFITTDELMSLLRSQGVYELQSVQHAYLEADGQLSVRKRGNAPEAGNDRRRMAH